MSSGPWVPYNSIVSMEYLQQYIDFQKSTVEHPYIPCLNHHVLIIITGLYHSSAASYRPAFFLGQGRASVTDWSEYKLSVKEL